MFLRVCIVKFHQEYCLPQVLNRELHGIVEHYGRLWFGRPGLLAQSPTRLVSGSPSYHYAQLGKRVIEYRLKLHRVYD